MSSSDPLQALEFYTQNNIIFLTGGTGFMGKVILEKILRSLPMVQKIYMLVRASSKAAAYGRLEREVFGCRIFETIKAQISNDITRFEEIKRKVVPILGDLTLDCLGISSEDLEIVRKDTRVFLNCAASVNFNDPLRVALELNTHGSLRTLEVAKRMTKLQAFVHISTSYVNAHLRNMNVVEKIYPLPFGDPEAFFCKLNDMSDQELSVFERDVVLKMYPSTYKFTKSLAEHLMQSRRKSLSLPLVIVRMPIVGGSLIEPVPGWCEGITGAAAVIVSCATGAVQEWYGEETKVVDMIPVDVVVKTILMAGPALVSKASVFNIISDTVPVIQIGTSSHCPLKVGYLFCHWENYWQQQPQLSQRLTNDIRFDFYSIPDFPRRYQQRFRMEIDLAKVSKDGAKTYGKMLRKAELVPKMFLPFMCYEWFFDAKNGLWLDDVAPMELHSGIRAQIDWHKYLHNFNIGVHDYILGEAVDRTKKIHYQLRILHKDFQATESEISDVLLRSRI
ncbi:MAG: male sterility protein-domain-containing protein [Linnemannia gamsii]|nr:MAG: male sterility protein-domain-containing protein [Linnemannia gamsii]